MKSAARQDVMLRLEVFRDVAGRNPINGESEDGDSISRRQGTEEPKPVEPLKTFN